MLIYECMEGTSCIEEGLYRKHLFWDLWSEQESKQTKGSNSVCNSPEAGSFCGFAKSKDSQRAKVCVCVRAFMYEGGERHTCSEKSQERK